MSLELQSRCHCRAIHVWREEHSHRIINVGKIIVTFAAEI